MQDDWPDIGLSQLAEVHGGRDLLAQLDGVRLSADNEDLDDPVLIRPDGQLIDTWREGYPFSERMPRAEYEMLKRLLQIELLKMQRHFKPQCFRRLEVDRQFEPRQLNHWQQV